MSTLPRFSPKRLREMADGTRNRDGSKKITVAEIQAKQSAMSKKVADALFGKVPNGADARAKAKAQADKYFSEFIRLRDSDEHGMATCITNPKIRKHWREMDCGHWISRAKESTRYDERNANAQSKQSNRFQGGHFLEHGLAIDRKFGPGTRDALEKKAGQLCKRTLNDYLFIADTYKAQVLRIKELEPQRYNSPSKAA